MGSYSFRLLYVGAMRRLCGSDGAWFVSQVRPTGVPPAWATSFTNHGAFSSAAKTTTGGNDSQTSGRSNTFAQFQKQAKEKEERVGWPSCDSFVISLASLSSPFRLQCHVLWQAPVIDIRYWTQLELLCHRLPDRGQCTSVTLKCLPWLSTVFFT